MFDCQSIVIFSAENVSHLPSSSIIHLLDSTVKKEVTNACGDIPEADDEEMEQEEMFVDADASLGTDKREWGGPRRGGRFPEPTRYGDWERKGRCSDF